MNSGHAVIASGQSHDQYVQILEPSKVTLGITSLRLYKVKLPEVNSNTQSQHQLPVSHSKFKPHTPCPGIILLMNRSILFLLLSATLSALRIHQCSQAYPTPENPTAHFADFEAAPTCPLIRKDLEKEKDITADLTEIYSLGRMPGQCNPGGISEAEKAKFIDNADDVEQKIASTKAKLLSINDDKNRKAAAELDKFRESLVSCVRVLNGNTTEKQVEMNVVATPVVVPVPSTVVDSDAAKIEAEKKKQQEVSKLIEQQKLDQAKKLKEEQQREALKAQEEQTRVQKERAERERLMKEKAEQQKVASQKAQQEKVAREKAEQNKIAQQKLAAQQQRVAEEKAKQDQLVKQKAEQERLAKQKAEQERVAKEKADKEEIERIKKEKAERLEKQKERNESEKKRLEQQKMEQQKAKENEEALRIQNEQQAAKNREEQQKVKAQERIRLIQLQKENQTRQQARIASQRVKATTPVTPHIVEAIPVPLVPINSSTLPHLPKQLATNPMANNTIIDNRMEIQQRLKKQLDDNTKDYEACPIDTPFYNGEKCIACDSLFNLNSRECSACPRDTKYNNLTLRCEKTIYVTNLNAEGIQLREGKFEDWTNLQARIRSMSPSNIVECPMDKPFADASGRGCRKCEGDKPLFNLLTSECQQCPVNTKYNKDTRYCQPTSRTASRVVEVNTVSTVPTAVVRAHPDPSTNTDHQTFVTNPSTYGVIVDTQDLESFTRKYNSKKANSHVSDCPFSTPYFNGSDCIACNGEDNLFRLSTKSCTKCGEGYEYTFKFRSCLAVRKED